ncbi:hypothetical protein TREMEDRAFT_59843 [Tremella mesenterica DSM 1558]|uniref:uncharacterized protein n=1 Tax=Tremella mesenterica (strain ATCC 24925 / CBS 8224 / DSM 1558 / NBRC 9311 / NRRL Y-6157 / RJB 2259-6 / UBC 559-6) TaxID=578456 RepID=UPI0003F4959E|nr:uncharacterized protein TREMEDRAFT_59843 [Tremella mesenterica DSM 1558]EIW73669.1 hypothetical protein TREMEDRAFT_59843 [Tremella mesenterica DSM 1558]
MPSNSRIVRSPPPRPAPPRTSATPPPPPPPTRSSMIHSSPSIPSTMSPVIQLDSNAPTVGGQVMKNGIGATPPMVNGKRMTSNPTIPNGNLDHPTPQTTQLPVQHPRPPSAPPASSFPWSTRPIKLYASQSSPPQPPVSPFPRYGLSVPGFPSHSGHMLLFGGLVHETVRNDLWSMDVRDCMTMLVKTKGDAPLPRVGHASAIADRIMLIWGGDTKVRPEDPQDEALYILDLRTQEWIKLSIPNGPVGRYGHAVCMHESKLFMFGGQAEGAFMDDFWAFDVKQLSGDQQSWEVVKATTRTPPKRTGHILMSYQGKIYLFGGTDGQFHYNDTWAYEVATGVWTELSCIGYIPTPREGHAAAIVDDVIYVFGGRDVNGKDLGDLAAFKISNHRWFMFQNMGPAPSARSGHSMVAAHGRIFVLGGEANATMPTQKDDPSLIHVLDTTKIKYPGDSQTPRVKAKTPEPGQTSVPQAPASIEQQTLQRGIPLSGSMDSLQQRAMSPALINGRPNGIPIVNGSPERPMPRSESLDAMAQQATKPIPNGVPQRPKREGDEEYRRAMSPQHGESASPVPNGSARVTSPPNAPGPSSPPQGVKHQFNASVVGTRSPSPRMRMTDTVDKPTPPSDAFYYARSPTANGFQGRPTSLSGTADLIRELKSREAEVDHGRKREAALRVVIGRAMAQGFVPDRDEAALIPNRDSDGGGTDQVLKDALIRLKQEKAQIQNEFVSQMRAVSEKAAEADRLRRGALQEAAFYRAKLATLESGSPIDLGRLEKERIAELERQLATLSAEHTNVQRDMERLSDQCSSDRQLHAEAIDRESGTLKRAEEAEEAHRNTLEELEDVRQKVIVAEASVRDHTERLITLSSLAQQREAERDQLRTKLDDAILARDQHLGLIEQAQSAIDAAGLRTTELEAQNLKSTSRIAELETELADTRLELEARTRDADMATQRMTEVENAYAQSREEADELRNLTTGGLGQVIDSLKEMRADEDRNSHGHREQIRALEEECNSLRRMLKEAGQRLDAAESGVSHHRTKARDFETQVQALRAEVRVHRNKLGKSHEETSKLKELQATRDAELRDREQAVTEMETRLTMMRNLLADHGIAVNDSEVGEVPTTRELEMQLRERTRELDNAQREIDELTRRCQEAENKVESLGRLVERIKDARSPTSLSMRSPSPPGEGERARVADVEKRMAEMEASHKEKVASLESDYQTAVKYVKGTERMMKRLKDELSRQKAANLSLQSEMDHLRGRASVEPGAPRNSGRATPSPNEHELQRKLATLQSQHTTMQAELNAGRDVLTAREREAEVMRLRMDESEREVEALRDELLQAQQRINTLLEMGQPFSDDDHVSVKKRDSASSEEASMAFDKFTKELQKWERTRSPQAVGSDGDSHSPELNTSPVGVGAHKRSSSDYSGNWAQ